MFWKLLPHSLAPLIFIALLGACQIRPVESQAPADLNQLGMSETSVYSGILPTDAFYQTPTQAIDSNLPIATVTSPMQTIPTQEPSPTPTETIPLSPEEQLAEYLKTDEAKKSIDEFVYAMNNAGIEITKEQVSEGLTIKEFKNKDGNLFVMISSFDGYPLFITEKNENGEWLWEKTSLRLGEIFGLSVGGSGNIGDSNHRDPMYRQLAQSEFSLWVDTGSFMEQTIHTWPPNSLTMPILKKDPSIKTRILHLFWHHDIPQGITPRKVDYFFNHRINDIMSYLKSLKGRNVEVLLVNEPLWTSQGHQGWIESPFYKAYGKQWITEAFIRLYNAARSQDLEYGKDYHVMLVNEYDIEIPTPKSRFVINTVSQIKRDIESKIGSPVEITIGLQFHVGANADGYIRVDPNWLKNEDKIPRLVTHFQELSKVGRLSITELDFDGRVSSEDEARILRNIFTAAKLSNVINDITFWSVLRANNPFKPDIFNPFSYAPTANYYTVLRTLVEE